jgi:hypothetical protein
VCSVGLSDTDDRFFVVQPDTFEEVATEHLDLMFRAPQDRLAAFHYFYDQDYSLKDLNDVYDYTDWLTGSLFENQKLSEESVRTNKDYALRSFVATDSSAKKTYCYIYVGKLQDEVVFSIITTNPESFEAALQDHITFSKEITWGKK